MTSFLVLGNGARENAIIRSLKKNKNSTVYSKSSEDVFKTISYLTDFIQSKNIDVVIIGPESLLEKGVVEMIEQNTNAKCVGPTSNLARIETDKAFARTLHDKYCTNVCKQPDFQFIKVGKTISKPTGKYVIKANGLRGGKGVQVSTVDKDTIDDYFDSLNGKEDFIVEELLFGEEFSLMSFTDGHTVLHTIPVQDYKRRNENNTGPNTGGMGCISYYSKSQCDPKGNESKSQCDLKGNNIGHILPFMRDIHVYEAQKCNELILKSPEMKGYKGILYGSYMLSHNNTTKQELYLIEYNARFGDPEAINVLSLLKTDFSDICKAIVNETLHEIGELEFEKLHSISVYAVPSHYPSSTQTHLTVPLPTTFPNVNTYWGVVNCCNDNKNVTLTNSRSFALHCKGSDFDTIRNDVYASLMHLNQNHFYFRTDIGLTYSKQLCCPSGRNATYSKQLHCPSGRNATYSKQLCCPSGRIENNYKSAGVNIEEGNKVVTNIKPLLGVNAGNFGGEYTLDGNVLVASTDGVGTKLLLANNEEDFFNLGIDLVNHCVNDILVQGATPLFFLDYIAMGKLNAHLASSFIRGVKSGCDFVNCVLIGGETAEMPDVYQDGKFDVCGTIVGRKVPKLINITGPETIQDGDILIGLSSNGLHTNGYSLARKVLPQLNQYKDMLLKNHTCYLQDVIDISKFTDIRAMCHITGGGFIDNLPRVLPKDKGVVIDTNTWVRPSIFDTIQTIGQITNSEMHKVFNCGIGMILIIPKDNVDSIKSICHPKGNNVDYNKYIIGYITTNFEKQINIV